jgi:hypothetical protein
MAVHRRTHCKNGHELSGEGKERRCYVCKTARQKLRYAADPKIRERHVELQRLRRLRQRAEEKQWLDRNTYCVNGHRRTTKNTRVKRHPDGTVERRDCRVCESERDRLRYISNPARREAMRQRALCKQREKHSYVEVGTQPRIQPENVPSHAAMADAFSRSPAMAPTGGQGWGTFCNVQHLPVRD